MADHGPSVAIASDPTYKKRHYPRGPTPYPRDSVYLHPPPVAYGSLYIPSGGTHPMFNLNALRLIARAFYGSMILFGLMITLFSFNAKAAETQPQTQTGIGGGSNTRYVNNERRAGVAPNITNVLVNFSSEVRERVEREGQYVVGRESEAEALDEKVSGRGKTVTVQGESGSGRTALVEEWIRLHPDVTVNRIDATVFATMDATDAAASLKTALLDLEKQNGADSGKRHVLYIDSLSVLQVGHGSGEAVPLNELWTQINRGINVPVIIESDKKTFEKVISESRYQNLNDLIDVLVVKAAHFDAVVAHLRRSRSQLEQSGAKFLNSAFERAADIATTHQRYRAFNWAYETLWRTGLQAQANLKGGGADQAALKGQIKRQEGLISSLQSDLEIVQDAKEKASLSAKLAQAQGALAEMNRKKTVENPVLAENAMEIENRIRIKEGQLAKMPGGGFLSKMIDSSSKAEREQVEQELKDLRTQLANKKSDLAAGTKSVAVAVVGENQVVDMAAKRLGMEPAHLLANFEEGVRRIREIPNEVYGQKAAIDALEAAFKRVAAGTEDGPKLTDAQIQEMKRSGLKRLSNKPISFWFFGPTGVGKTETAKQLADKTGYKLKILDMTDFAESHSVARLKGAPPGYVGFDQEPDIFNFVDENPQSIVLFDEIEKAHPAILDTLIPVLDEGRLSRANGKGSADFRNVILIFTSNLAQEIGQWTPERLSKFLQDTKKWTPEQVRANTNNGDINLLRQAAYVTFITDKDSMAGENRLPMRPEIARRIGAFIGFDRLSPESATRVADKTLDRLVHKLKVVYGFKSVRFTRDMLTKVLLAFDADGGGRTLADSFKRLIADNLADPLLSYKAQMAGMQDAMPGDTLLVDLDPSSPGKLAVKIVAPEEVTRAEALNAKAPSNVVSAEAVLARRAGVNGVKRDTWAGTSQLVDMTLERYSKDKSMYVETRAFRAIRGRR